MEVVKSKPFQMQKCGGREAMNLMFQEAASETDVPARHGQRAWPCPLLDAMVPAFVKAAGSSPTRMAILYFPNGVQMDTWAIKSDAHIAALPDALPRTLAPLTKYRNDITVLNGLTVDGGRAHGDGPGDHGRAGASYLTGAHPKKTFGKDLQAGVSMDQYAAGIIGSQTRYRVARTRMRRGHPGRQLRQRLQLRVQQQHLVAHAVDAESSGDSSARRLRASVRRRRDRARSGEARAE